jgi:hypothetical protein
MQTTTKNPTKNPAELGRRRRGPVISAVISTIPVPVSVPVPVAVTVEMKQAKGKNV